jgi:hypothetical protein
MPIRQYRRSIADTKPRIQALMDQDQQMSIFDEQYRVVAIEGNRLVIRGILSGKVLTIVNPEPATPLTPEDYPLGKLIALTDPSIAPLN